MSSLNPFSSRFTPKPKNEEQETPLPTSNEKKMALKPGRVFIPKSKWDPEITMQEMVSSIPQPILDAIISGQPLPPPLLFKAPENVVPPPPDKLALHPKYKNPVNIRQVEIESVKQKDDWIVAANQDKDKAYQVIDLEHFVNLRKHCTEKPAHMNKMDFPHRSKLFKKYTDEDFSGFWENPDSKFNQFNENVWKLWEYLNKLTRNNYLAIRTSILTKFRFSA